MTSGISPILAVYLQTQTYLSTNNDVIMECKKVITEQKVVMEQGKPRLILLENGREVKHISIDEAKRIAFEYFLKLEELSRNTDMNDSKNYK